MSLSTSIPSGFSGFSKSGDSRLLTNLRATLLMVTLRKSARGVGKLSRT